jgi:pyridoxal phosphate enzyme (YggS family)
MVKENLENILKRIQITAINCDGNAESVRLVAVTKTVPAHRVKDAIEAGATIFGENYVQEARDKIRELSAYPVSWHFIGTLQSNKAKYVVKLFDLIHSVDSVKLATEINKQAEKIGKIQDILIQVNVAGEPQKSGISPVKTLEMLKAVSKFENISVKGLMTMPPYFNDPERARPFFKQLRQLRNKLQKELSDLSSAGHIRLDELSMGMTGDFEAAIHEGATLVRIGTAIFGERV